ncbi:GTPase Era [Bdellovibrionota bacterium FG-1]
MNKAGFVAIIGRPNAGKSTLLNSILGVKVSIVTPKAQTTRERVLGILTDKKGQIVFVDTPGIHTAKAGGINEYMVNEAKEALDGPSVVWYLVDPTSGLEHEATVLNLLQAAPRCPIFLLFTKWDLKGRIYSLEQLEKLEALLGAEMIKRAIPPEQTLRISAEKEKELGRLLEATWTRIPQHPHFFPDTEQLSDRPTRFFVAEKVREQLFRCLGDELPYSCAVEIERFDEKVTPPRIEAVIHVERDSQKGMVIGKGGQKIKEIGTAARREVEEFLGHPVFLGLKVNVLKDWTKNAKEMKRMGYLLPKRPGGDKK